MSYVTKFPDRNELKRFARYFVTDRINSLDKDVLHCLQAPFAPFPAILYFLSIIDLLGALTAGQGAKKEPSTGKCVDTTENSKTYMQRFMNYTEEQSNLFTNIFRHKLVHLAQPRPVILHKNSIMAWTYHHDNKNKHLLLEKAPPDTRIQVKTGWEINVDQIFNLGILQLKDDVFDSVVKHGGYLDNFETDTHLQNMFGKAIEEIYQP
jgi:hypothetical protein